jgi:AcrR family transcriptional regulator
MVSEHSPTYQIHHGDDEEDARSMNGRERILDGAFEVMRTRGVARATTKEIAGAADLSEAALYKFFKDKEEIFLCVLKERLPRIALFDRGVDDVAGTGELEANLRAIAREVTRFYEESLPIAMSLFSDTQWLAQHRESVRAKQAGPEAVIERVTAYLRAEQALGRVRPDAWAGGAATALVGACMHLAFLTRFDQAGTPAGTGASTSPQAVSEVVDALLPGLMA